MRQFTLIVLMVICGVGFGQYNPFETSFSDTVFNANKQPSKITFYDFAKKEVGISTFEYHENDTVKTLHFTGQEGEIISHYNKYGHLLESTTQRGSFLSKYIYDYEYDAIGQLIRVRGYNTGGLLFISNRYSYSDGLQSKIERFNTSDQLFDWTEYQYDSLKNFVSSVTYNADTLMIKTRKKMQLTPEGKVKEYLIKYSYENGQLSTMEVFPSDVTFGEMRETRKTVVFNVENKNLKSFTYFELNENNNSVNNKGQLIVIDDSSKNHPLVQEFNYVMSCAPKGFSKNVERSIELPKGFH